MHIDCVPLSARTMHLITSGVTIMQDSGDCLRRATQD